jgi:hypothetical protein
MTTRAPTPAITDAALAILEEVAPRAGRVAASDHAHRLLCRCGARALDSAAQARLHATVAELGADDWASLGSLAQAQGMASLVFEHLARAGLLDVVPPETTGALRQSYVQTLLNNRRLQTVLQSVLSALASQDIPVMAIKGLALALRYYQSLALRPISDIDVLLRPQDITRATQVLRHLGFAADHGMGRPTGFYALTSAVVVYAKAMAPPIEMHWELFGRGPYRASLPASTAWQRAQTIELLGVPVCYLDQRDELRYLCVHAAAEHQLERLIWLVDIVEIVRALPPDWDWTGFVADTIAAGMARPAAAALAYCHVALELTLPPTVLERLWQAGSSERERVAWEGVQAALLSEDWLRATRLDLHGPLAWAIYLRGVLLPRGPTLALLYGPARARLRTRTASYARHWRRTLPLLLAALRR